MVKYIFLEGKPGAGKTKIINEIRSRHIKSIKCVEELLLPIQEKISNNKITQEDFMKNDDNKISKYSQGIIFIDRGPISTLSYNIAKHQLDKHYNYDLKKIYKWFYKYADFFQSDDVYIFYLLNASAPCKINSYNKNDPYGTINNQNVLETITVEKCKEFCKNLFFIDYDYSRLGEFVDEIINKFVCT